MLFRSRLGLRLRLRKFSVVSHCGKRLKARSFRDGFGPRAWGPTECRGIDFQDLGKYGKKEAVMKKNLKKPLTGSVGSILFPSP